MHREQWQAWHKRLWRNEQSGLSGAEWCRQERLPLEQLCLWRRKRSRTPAPGAPWNAAQGPVPTVGERNTLSGDGRPARLICGRAAILLT